MGNGKCLKCAKNNKSGVIGMGNNDKITSIPFSEIKGGKSFDIHTKWFKSMLKDIGQIIK